MLSELLDYYGIIELSYSIARKQFKKNVQSFWIIVKIFIKEWYYWIL